MDRVVPKPRPSGARSTTWREPSNESDIDKMVKTALAARGKQDPTLVAEISARVRDTDRAAFGLFEKKLHEAVKLELEKTGKTLMRHESFDRTIIRYRLG